MADNSQQGNARPETPTAVKDVLLASYKEHTDEARQHENQRERMTTLIIAIGAGALGLASGRADWISFTLLGWVLVVLGIYGATFSLIHYVRSRRHMYHVSAIAKKLEELYPQTALESMWNDAEKENKDKFGLLMKLKPQYLWIGLPLMVSVLGVALLLSR